MNKKAERNVLCEYQTDRHHRNIHNTGHRAQPPDLKGRKTAPSLGPQRTPTQWEPHKGDQRRLSAHASEQPESEKVPQRKPENRAELKRRKEVEMEIKANYTEIG